MPLNLEQRCPPWLQVARPLEHRCLHVQSAQRLDGRRKSAMIVRQQTCALAVSPLECTGYRLPTEWEWEYAARSGTTEDLWTGRGRLGGMFSRAWNDCSSVVMNGVNNPSLLDYAWYCGNNLSRRESPGVTDGFGLYDMHGNVQVDGRHFAVFKCGGVDPWSGYVGMSTPTHIVRGGYYGSYMHSVGLEVREKTTLYLDYQGYRLVIRAPVETHSFIA